MGSSQAAYQSTLSTLTWARVDKPRCSHNLPTSQVQDPLTAVFGIVKDLEEYGQPMVLRSSAPLKELVKRLKIAQATGAFKQLKSVQFQEFTTDSNPHSEATEAEEDENLSTVIPAQI